MEPINIENLKGKIEQCLELVDDGIKNNLRFQQEKLLKSEIHQEMLTLMGLRHNKNSQSQTEDEGYSLYQIFVQQLNDYVKKNISQQQSYIIDLENILKQYSKYQAYFKKIRLIFKALDQTYVQSENILDIQTMSLCIFFKKVFLRNMNGLYHQFQHSLANHIIYDDEHYATYPIKVLQDFCDLLIQFQQIPDEYRSNFLEDFKNQTVGHIIVVYKQQYESWNQILRTPNEFLKELKKFQNRQQEILTTILILKTRENINMRDLKNKIIEQAKIIIIQEYKKKLVDPSMKEGFSTMLERVQKDNLQLVYDNYIEMNDKFALLSKAFKDFIFEEGKFIFDQKVKQVVNSNFHLLQITKDDEFIAEIINLHQKFSEVMHTCFKDNPDLKQAMNNGFELFINQKIGDFEMYEYLAFYSNQLLISDKEDSYQNLENVKQLFGYLNQKDCFIKVYQHLLAKRLLFKKDQDFVKEKTLLTKIRELLGSGSVNNLEEMIEEYQQANPVFSEINNSLSQILDMDIKIFSKLKWPEFQEIDQTPLTSQIEKCKQETEALYKKIMGKTEQSERKLSWVNQLTQLIISFKSISGKEYLIHVSYYQAKILFQFQYQNKIEEKDLLRLTYLSDSIFQCNKESLVQQNLLIYDLSTHSYIFNDNYSRDEVIIKVPFLYDDKPLEKKNLENEREVSLEAAIIKIMKIQKQMYFHELIKEVQKYLKNFNPLVEQIKNRIERLINLDYLIRDCEKYEIIKYI